MFNRNEQIVLLLLCCILIVGIVIAYIDNRDPERVPDFEVRKSAVPVPEEKAEVARDSVAAAEVRKLADVPPAAEKTEAAEALIDLNRATAKELERLPGIGPQIAARIVAYREQNGAFKRVEDITKVRGIGPKTLERLRPHLTASTP